MVLWGCFAASGAGGLEGAHGIMKSADYQVFESNVQPSVQKLRSGPGCQWRGAAGSLMAARSICWQLSWPKAVQPSTGSRVPIILSMSFVFIF